MQRMERDEYFGGTIELLDSLAVENCMKQLKPYKVQDQ